MLVCALRVLLPLLLSIVLSATSAHGEETSLLRVFLVDGTTLTSFGEYARVGDRIVFSMPLGSGREGIPPLQLVSLPERHVDWARTDAYRETARAAQYAAAQGENDFALMTGDVARVLNEIALAKDPAHRLRLAEQARAQLAEWPAKHYGYRAKDVREIAALLDETIADLRAAAGGNQVDLSFVANIEPPAPVLLLPPPTRTEVIAQALSIAEMADVPADRIAMLQKTVAFIDSSAEAGLDAGLQRARDLAQRRLERELDVDRRYTGFMRTLTAQASASAARADVRGVERVIAQVARLDEQFGQQRPADVRSLTATLHAHLDSARRLRLARDRWRLRLAGYRSYSRFVKSPLAQLDLMRPGLQDIKTLAGPEAVSLGRLTARATQAARELRGVIPPPDLAPIHALLQSACQMASAAVETRFKAVASGDMATAWNASSAAAGSLMLLARARDELERYLVPPRQP
ncbi:MAG TPA: hypothetical protein VE505_13270 [Vicinamibacterales bacterium]|nr:hypothetical protein [Vicinamibacterales bacterium]